MEIDFKKYLSDEDIKDIVIEEARNIVRKSFHEIGDMKRRMQDYERVIGNAVHHYLEKEIDGMIGSDHKHFIEKYVDKVIKDNSTYRYSVFRKKSHWETEDSAALKYLEQAVEQNKSIIEEKVKQRLTDLDDNYFEELVRDLTYDVIKDKLTS